MISEREATEKAVMDFVNPQGKVCERKGLSADGRPQGRFCYVGVNHILNGDCTVI